MTPAAPGKSVKSNYFQPKLHIWISGTVLKKFTENILQETLSKYNCGACLLLYTNANWLIASLSTIITILVLFKELINVFITVLRQRGYFYRALDYLSVKSFFKSVSLTCCTWPSGQSFLKVGVILSDKGPWIF